jgi:predicted amidophosphoribosyltransferase
MPSLRPCPACKRQVSTGAKSCPQCGHAFKRDNQMSLSDPVHLIGFAIVALFVVLWVAALFKG